MRIVPPHQPSANADTVKLNNLMLPRGSTPSSPYLPLTTHLQPTATHGREGTFVPSPALSGLYTNRVTMFYAQKRLSLQ
jgi:hypothetical protein